MKERFSSIASITILAILGLSVWWAANYTQQAVESESRPRFTHELDAYAKNFVYLRSNQEGQLNSRLEGEYIEHFPDDDSFVVLNPRAFNQHPTRPAVSVVAQQGIMDQDGARITLKGDVHLFRPAGLSSPPLDIRSQTMTVFPDEDIVKTDSDTKIIHGQSVIQGRGMVYNNVTRELQVQQQTRVEIPPRNAQPISH